MERYAPLTGTLSVVVALVAWILLGDAGYLADPAEVGAHFTDNAGEAMLAGWLGVVAAFLMLWFSTSVKALLGAREGGRHAYLAFAGTLVASIAMALTFALMFSGGARADADSGISDAAAALIYDTAGTIFSFGVALGLAALIAGFSIVGKRSGFVPTWLVWVGALVALGLITPFAYIALAPGAAFVIGISIWGYRQTG